MLITLPTAYHIWSSESTRVLICGLAATSVPCCVVLCCVGGWCVRDFLHIEKMSGSIISVVLFAVFLSSQYVSAQINCECESILHHHLFAYGFWCEERTASADQLIVIYCFHKIQLRNTTRCRPCMRWTTMTDACTAKRIRNRREFIVSRRRSFSRIRAHPFGISSM